MRIQYPNKSFIPQKVEIVSPQPVSVHADHMADNNKGAFSFSKNLADGSVQTVEVCEGMLLTVSDFLLTQDTQLDETYTGQNIFQISFALNGLAEWTYNSGDEHLAQSFCLGARQSSVRIGPVWRCSSKFYGGLRFRSVSITLDEQKYSNVLQCIEARQAQCAIGQPLAAQVYPFGPRVEHLLEEIITCPLENELRTLYLQGKILELLAVYCDEVICRSPANCFGGGLRPADYAALLRAKDIIDRDYARPLTIAALAREALVNEQLLKSGFKRCFGRTVNDYLADRRMEAAHALLLNETCKVSEAAWRVGYAHTGYFIRQFRAHYGLTPGELLKNNK